MKIIFMVILSFLLLQQCLYANEVKNIPHQTELLSSKVINNISSFASNKSMKYNPFEEIKWPSLKEIEINSNLIKYKESYLLENNMFPHILVEENCIFWIKKILNKNFIPDDLKSRLIFLQYKNPIKSKVICRYFINDMNIQIINKVSAITMVITPINKFYNSSKFNFASFFRILFTKGEKISKLKYKKKYQDFPIYIFKQFNPKGLFWDDFIIVYLDKQSVIISINKNNGQRIPRHGSPWF